MDALLNDLFGLAMSGFACLMFYIFAHGVAGDK